MKQLDRISDEMTRIVESGMQVLLEQIEEPADNTMLRKLGKVYDTLSIEDIAAVLSASGHTQGEKEPCDVCKLIAKEELKLREE